MAGNRTPLDYTTTFFLRIHFWFPSLQNKLLKESALDVKSWGNLKISQRTFSICGSRPKLYVLAKMLTFPKLCWPPPHPWGELNKESLESTSSWPQKLVRCGQWHLKIVVKSIPQWRFYPGKSFHPAVSLFQWSSTPSSSICRRSLFLNAIV